ncbi:MAG: hypothetical protein ACYDCX_06080 [Acidithiobacillus sp.]
MDKEFKGHAFTVGDVTVDLTHHYGKAHHPLPNTAYAMMLKWELDKAFANGHLGEGIQPAIPVNVVITGMDFKWSHFDDWTLAKFYALAQIGDGYQAEFCTYDGNVIYVTPHTPMLLHRYQIPGMASVITNYAHGLQEGRGLTSMTAILVNYLPVFRGVVNFTGNAPYGTFGMTPMTLQQTESITGLTKEQIAEYVKKAGA